MTAKKKPALRLRVGRTYVDRNGNKLRITGRINGKKSNFIGEDGCVYFPDGSFAPKGTACQFDLIREVSAPKPARKRKAAKPASVTAWVAVAPGNLIVPSTARTMKRLVKLQSGVPDHYRVVRVRIVEVRR